MKSRYVVIYFPKEETPLMKQFLSINERLKDLRTNRHMHLDDLVAETWIPKQTLSNYEQDNYPVPHTIILQLADYYGISTDYLLGITETPTPAITPISQLHLSDDAIDKICSTDINSRLLSEIIESEAFRQFLIDAEVYVDGYVEQSVDSYNTLMDFARRKVLEKYGNETDNTSEALAHSKVAQHEYFGRLFANDLIQILDEIKERHSKDKDTSDGAFTPEQYERIYQAVLEHRSGPLKGLGAGILEALHIKKNDINLKNIDTLIESDQPDEKEITDLLGQSAVIEPDARKRRKR